MSFIPTNYTTIIATKRTSNSWAHIAAVVQSKRLSFRAANEPTN